jgi:outer membrane receptor protein involved in Fe transport
VNASALNVFDEEYDLTTWARTPGRVFTFSGEVRF